MEKITTVNHLGIEHVFEVVNKIPEGFMVWNIGDNMNNDDYIPLCEWKYPDKVKDGNCNIRLDTLKAIKLDTEEVKLLRRASAYGVYNLENTKKVVAKGNPSKDNWYIDTKWDLANKVLPIFERIS